MAAVDAECKPPSATWWHFKVQQWCKQPTNINSKYWYVCRVPFNGYIVSTRNKSDLTTNFVFTLMQVVVTLLPDTIAVALVPSTFMISLLLTTNSQISTRPRSFWMKELGRQRNTTFRHRSLLVRLTWT